MHDDGFPFLPGGLRLPKTDPIFDALGSLDELAAALGLLRATLSAPPEAAFLEILQRDLQFLGSELATGRPCLPAAALETLENETAALAARRPPAQSYARPGANEPSARAHWARTVCRRAERDTLRALAAHSGLSAPLARSYLNRLSTYLFGLARALEP